MATNKLTDAQCRQAKPTEKAQKLSDGNGMFLFITPKGAKVWRMAYTVDGKEQTAVLGPYPLLTLADARNKRDELRRKLLDGIDIKAKKKASITFSEACTQYWAGRKDVSPGYLDDATRGLALHLKPVASMLVCDITKADLLAPLMILNSEEKFVYARRIRLWASMVLSWAMSHDHCTENVADQINPKTAFGRKKVKHFASLKLREVSGLLQRLALEKELQSVLACRLMACTWVRTKELRLMRWVDVEGDLWRIPDHTMKKDREHLVPLCTQALALLEKLKARCRGSEFVFPNDRRQDRPMSENSVLYLLGRIGYGGLMTGHGWRSVASTWGNENGYEPDVIEIALSHSSDAKDAVRSAYNQAEYLPQRRVLLQDFADWLDIQEAATPA
jgi:integrase